MMKLSPIKLITYAIFSFMLTVMFGFPIIAFYSTYEVYDASNNYTKPEEINMDELEEGDAFWGQTEISVDNKDTAGLVAYTSYYWYKTTHMWNRKDLNTNIPEKILVNAGENKNIELQIKKDIIDLWYLHPYDSPVVGFFSITDNTLLIVNLSEEEEDGSRYKAIGLKEEELLFAKYRVESTNPLVLSTSNPAWHAEPEKIWKKFKHGDFYPFAHILSGVFFLFSLLIIRAKLKAVFKKK